MCEIPPVKNTYNNKVLLDGWVDDRVLEEEAIKDFLSKRDSGQLMIQKMGSLLNKMSQKSDISISGDGYVRFGDMIQLVNPGSDANYVRLQRVSYRRPTCLSVDAADEMLYFRNELPDPSTCTASFKVWPMSRNVFRLVSPEGKGAGSKVNYGEPLMLTSNDLLSPPMYLTSDNNEFMKKAKFSLHQELSVSAKKSFLAHFIPEFIDPRYRLEHEGCPIKVSTKFVLKHAKSNQALAVEDRFFGKTFFGYEHELTCHTYLNDHRAEMDVNHWIFKGQDLDGGNVELYGNSYCHEAEEPDHV